MSVRSKFSGRGRMAAALAVLSFLSPAAGAETAQEFRKIVLFENEEVQVLDLQYPPGSVAPLHGHEYPHRVLYVEAGGTLEIVPGRKGADGALELEPGAQGRVVNLTPGQTLWLPAQTHLLRNIGKTFVRVIEIEIKKSGR